jgi:serine/threonine-protein kinase
MVMGTPSYMSPEQCQGQVVDRRSDLFSAAVVFYELVAGEKPFSGALETIAYKICHEDPRPASTVSRLSLSPMIDAVIATALEKNPESRFQNAKALSRALRQACEALSDVTDDPLGATQINIAGVKMEPPSAAPAWDDTVLRTIERQFAHYVGPMARVMIRRAAEQTTDVDELYSLQPGSNDPVHRQRTSTKAAAASGGVARGSPARPPKTCPSSYRGAGAPSSIRATMRLATSGTHRARRRQARRRRRQDEFAIIADHLGAQDQGAFREIGFDG